MIFMKLKPKERLGYQRKVAFTSYTIYIEENNKSNRRWIRKNQWESIALPLLLSLLVLESFILKDSHWSAIHNLRIRKFSMNFLPVSAYFLHETVCQGILIGFPNERMVLQPQIILICFPPFFSFPQPYVFPIHLAQPSSLETIYQKIKPAWYYDRLTISM